MMKILHTSDIHLQSFQDERWDALVNLLEIGKEQEIDVFTISGDLFDKENVGEDLRPNLRKIFSDCGFNIVILPGNHDSGAYRSGLYYGEGVTILNEITVPFEYDTVRIWGIPYESLSEKEVLEKLHIIRSNLTEDKTNILLYHGELLDAFFSRKDFGEEGEERYMPVKLSYFQDLNINYILAGHFHSRYEVWQFGEQQFFVYPSSPISITRKELGIRKVNLFEVGKPPQEFPLNTPHFEEIHIDFNPFTETDPLDVVKKSFLNLHPQARVILKIGGYLDNNVLGISEEELVDQINNSVADKCEVIDYDFRDISIILEDELFRKFLKKLDATEYDEKIKDEMKNLVIKSMMGIKL